MLTLEVVERLIAAMPGIDVHDDYARLSTRRDANAGVGPPLPPLAQRRRVGGGAPLPLGEDRELGPGPERMDAEAVACVP